MSAKKADLKLVIDLLGLPSCSGFYSWPPFCELEARVLYGFIAIYYISFHSSNIMAYQYKHQLILSAPTAAKDITQFAHTRKVKPVLWQNP